MEPEILSPPQTVSHNVKYHAQPLALALRVSDGLEPDCIVLTDSTGKLRITIPRVALPFGVAGDTMIVSICFMKADVTSALLRVN